MREKNNITSVSPCYVRCKIHHELKQNSERSYSYLCFLETNITLHDKFRTFVSTNYKIKMNLSSIFFDFIEQNKNPAPFREAGFLNADCSVLLS